jgi:site-specific recombinase XerD
MDIDNRIKKEALRRGYSNRTIKTYIYCVRRFFKKCKKDPKKVTKKDVREFLENLAEKGKSGNTVNVYLNSLKFLFEEVLGKKMKVNLKYSKIPKRLPSFLSKEEIIRLFNKIRNEKHRLMVEMIYSAGLRASEVINLRVDDLKIDEGYGFVRGGKGNKDRIFIIAKKLKERLKFLIDKENLEDGSFLFKSNRRRRYHQRSLQNIIKVAAKRANIKKRVTPPCIET